MSHKNKLSPLYFLIRESKLIPNPYPLYEQSFELLPLNDGGGEK